MTKPLDPNDPETYLNRAELRRFKALMATRENRPPKNKKNHRSGRKNKLFAGIPLRQWAILTNKAPQWIHYLYDKGQLSAWLIKHGFIDKDLSA